MIWKEIGYQSEYTKNQEIRGNIAHVRLLGKISIGHFLIPDLTSNQKWITHMKENAGTRLGNIGYTTCNEILYKFTSKEVGKIPRRASVDF